MNNAKFSCNGRAQDLKRFDWSGGLEMQGKNGVPAVER
jgi:hypothetical protein